MKALVEEHAALTTGAVCYATSLSQHIPLDNFRDRLLDSGVYAKRGFYGWWYGDQSDRR